MTKKDKPEQVVDNHGIGGSGVVVAADFDSIEVAKDDEQIGVGQILQALGEMGDLGDTSPEDWRPAIVVSDYFWPAARGMVIRGVVLGVEERMTSLVIDGKTVVARFYTLELTSPCLAIRSEDMVKGQEIPPPVQCLAGMHVAVLERTILRRLEASIGREVIVVCDGPAKTKRGLNLWKYRSWERRTVEVLSTSALGGQERRALPAASAS